MKHIDGDVVGVILGLVISIALIVLVTLSLTEYEEMSAKEWAIMYYEQQEVLEDAKDELEYCAPDGDYEDLMDCLQDAKYKLEYL